ncbi:MAG TPA: hypothetical protein PKM21_06495 [Anaerolineales bacterium]|nr:hypothetical protein [Anaerolineales bacterium]
MKTLPYFIASAASAAIQCLYQAVVMVISAVALRSLLENADLMGEEYLPAIVGGSVSLSCVGIVGGIIVHIGSGLLYAFLHRREGSLSTQDGAIGGAASAGTAAWIAGLFSVMTSIIFSSVIMRGTGAPGDINGLPFMAINAVSSSSRGLLGGCFNALLAAALGALGGILASMFNHN